MSHKTTVNNTNIVVINGIIAQVAGTKPLSPTATDKDVEKALKEALVLQWKVSFPDVNLPGGNIAFGYFGPFSKVTDGQAPSCVVNEVNQDFKNWQIPVDTGVAKQIADTITTNLFSTGGQAIQLTGTTPSGPNVDIDWLCLAGLGNASDVVYVFAGAAQVDIG